MTNGCININRANGCININMTNGYMNITCHKWLSYQHDINGYINI